MMRGAASAMVVESANAVLAEIFGPDSRAFVEAMYLKNEILGIRVAGSAGSMEIRLREFFHPFNLLLEEVVGERFGY